MGLGFGWGRRRRAWEWEGGHVRKAHDVDGLERLDLLVAMRRKKVKEIGQWVRSWRWRERERERERASEAQHRALWRWQILSEINNQRRRGVLGLSAAGSTVYTHMATLDSSWDFDDQSFFFFFF